MKHITKGLLLMPKSGWFKISDYGGVHLCTLKNLGGSCDLVVTL